MWDEHQVGDAHWHQGHFGGDAQVGAQRCGGVMAANDAGDAGAVAVHQAGQGVDALARPRVTAVFTVGKDGAAGGHIQPGLPSAKAEHRMRGIAGVDLAHFHTAPVDGIGAAPVLGPGVAHVHLV